MSEDKSKPEHNKFDNIYELRMRNNYGRRRLKEILELCRHRSPTDYWVMASKRWYHGRVESFIYWLFRRPVKNLRVWKVLAPHLDDPRIGAVYYIFEDAVRGTIHCYRATYGYGGSGPHEAAVIEEAIEVRKLFIELRDADYLLGLLGFT